MSIGLSNRACRYSNCFKIATAIGSIIEIYQPNQPPPLNVMWLRYTDFLRATGSTAPQ